MNAVSASDRRDVRARLEAFRQNPRPLVVAPAPPTRRPGDLLDPAIDLVVIAIVLMSIIRTIIFHSDTRRIHGLPQIEGHGPGDQTLQRDAVIWRATVAQVYHGGLHLAA